jgi:subtilisin family serine protease
MKNYLLLVLVVLLASSVNLFSAKQRIVAKVTEAQLEELGITESEEVIPGWRVFVGDSSTFAQLEQAGVYAEPDWKMELYDVNYDSLFSLQWGLTASDNAWQGDFRKAWEITRGNPNIKIGIIDSGSPIKDGKWTHPDLDSSRFIIGPNFVGMGDNGENYFPDYFDQTITDFNGHSTHIAGIIAASHNGKGIEGIDTAATIVIYKAFTRFGIAYYSWIANAIYRAVHDGCRILNMSFGGIAYSRLLEEAMIYAHKNGVISVVAAGNTGAEVQSFPAFFARFTTQENYREGLSSVIVVGAINNEGNIAFYSNRGWFVDIYAPGGTGYLPMDEDDILSTFPTYTVTLNDTSSGFFSPQYTYGYLAGTSMATPFVVGTASLMLAVNPDLTPEEVKEILISTADSILTINEKAYILNPGAAVAKAQSKLLLPIVSSDRKIPITDFSLSQNYPNPFNPETTIRFNLPKESFVTLKVYNILGKEVATLVNEKKQPGEYKVKWRAENLPSGTYIYQLRAGGFSEAKKMVLLK